MTVSVQVTSIGTPTMVRATSGSVTGSWQSGQSRLAGDVLVAIVTAGGSTASAAALSTPSGWTQRAVISNTPTTANAWVAVYTKTAAGSDSAPAFTATLSGTVAMTCTLLELAAGSCLYPADTYGTYASGGTAATLSSMSATTLADIMAPGEYAIGVFAQEAAAATNTWTPGTSWTNLVNDGSTSTVLHTSADYYANPPDGATLNEAGHWTTDTSAFGAGIVIAVAPQLDAQELFTNLASTTISSGGTGAPAAGTPEVWTAASWSAFPAVAQTGTPPTICHLADPALPSETIALLNSTTGLVIRGADGTTPVAHAGGFTVQNVISQGWLDSLAGLRASGDTTGATDRGNIQGLLNLAGKSTLQPGQFYLDAALSMTTGYGLYGSGPGTTTISQVSTAANGINISGTTVANVHLEGFKLAGPGSGSGTGISGSADSGANPLTQMVLRNLIVSGFGVNGVALECPIVTTIDNVLSESNGGAGYYLYGGGTSLTAISSYANGNASGRGWYLDQMSYSTLSGCASDSNALGYEFYECTAVNAHGCGCESTVAANSLDGTSFKIDGGSVAVGLWDCFSYQNGAAAFYVTGDSQYVTLWDVVESDPAGGATASIKSDAGTMLTLANFSVVTAAALTSGTYNEINDGTTGESSWSGPVYYNDTADFFGVANFYAGTTTNNTATASTPSLSTGVAAQINTTQDVMLYASIHAGTANFSLAIGSTSGTTTTIVASAASVDHTFYSVRVPAGWYVNSTFTAADVTWTAVTC